MQKVPPKVPLKYPVEKLLHLAPILAGPPVPFPAMYPPPLIFSKIFQTNKLTAYFLGFPIPRNGGDFHLLLS
jgi:hypothetical protein